MVSGLRHFSQRAGNVSDEPVVDEVNGEELVYAQCSVAIAFGNRDPLFPGTLHITSKQVIWLSDIDSSLGYAVDFLSLSLHAVSRDPEAYSSPCIYTQIDIGDDEIEMEDSDSDQNEVLDLSRVTEMRLIPTDPTRLDDLFEIFCECAELNPEPVEENEDVGNNWIFSADQIPDGDESEWHFSESDVNSIGRSNGIHDLAQSVLELQINDERFEDADEMEHDNGTTHH